MEKQMLRAALSELEEKQYLETCYVEVDPKYEMGAVLKYFNNEKPILFNKVKGSPNSAVGGLFGDRDIYYEMMNTTKDERITQLMNAVANPKPFKRLNKGPIMENIFTKNIDIERMFPIPTFHGEDSSSFITAGVVVVKDPETGKYSTSVRRLQVNARDELSILIASPLATEQFIHFENQNKPFEVAIILGYDYPFLLASQISTATYGVDKYEVDSALRGEPLELVKCSSIDLEVPAYAEIVLEGVMVPNKRKPEGPFGELMGYYGNVGNHPIVDIKAVMHRNNPIMQVAFPCREEHLANGLAREMELYTYIKNMVEVVDVNVTVSGGCRFHAVVSINKKTEGDGKSAIIAALASNKDMKHVVIVDDDVDIYSHDAIEWAIATRFQASKDIVIIPGGIGSGLEPSHSVRGVTDKLGFDATKPVGEGSEKFEKAKIPGYETIDIKRYFPKMKK